MAKTAALFLKPLFSLACLTIVLAMFLVTVAINTSYAQAPQDDEVKPLGEILNPTKKDLGEGATAKERGNIYYKECMKTESLAFDDEEKTMLCACTAAKLPEVLTSPEFTQLYKDTKAGRNARMKTITYAYTECMNQAVNDKVYKDCMYGKDLSGVINGKKAICNCTVDYYEDLLNVSAPDYFMKAIRHAPMTLNPLERHFSSETYFYNLKRYTKTCRSRLMYEKDYPR